MEWPCVTIAGLVEWPNLQSPSFVEIGQNVGMAKKPRGRETARDMIWSMGVVLGLVAIILVITWREKPNAVRVVDYKSVVEQVKSTAPWPLLVPSSVPADWQATSARFEVEDSGEQGDVRWYLGFMTGDEKFVASWQTDGPIKNAMKAAVSGAQCDSGIKSDSSWVSCVLPERETNILVKSDGNVSVIVYGTVSPELLSTYANSLTPTK